MLNTKIFPLYVILQSDQSGGLFQGMHIKAFNLSASATDL